MVLPTERATTLKAAYRICDVKPLEARDIQQYYVPLAARQDAIINLQAILRNQEPGEFTTLLFTGHVGCGKTSELIRIAQNYQEQYQIVFLKAEEQIDVNDVEYTDLYLLIIKQIEYVMRQAGLKFDSALLTSFENWFREITNESEETVERSVNVEAEASLGSEAPFLAKFLVKILAQIKGASIEKRTIREILRQDVSRLKTDINLLLRDGLQKLQAKFPDKQGFLIILDGLDKCPRDVAERLFFDYSAQLRELHCTLIYTVPIGSLYTTRGIGPAFEPAHKVPMVNVYQYEPDRLDLDYDPEGLEAMAALVERRVDSELVFESREQLLELCRASGGHPRFLMQMMRMACLTADGRGHTKVQDDDISYAIKQLQFDFERRIPRKYYGEVVKIAQFKKLTEDDFCAELLFSTAVLEYNGNLLWAYPNPLVRRSDLFKRTLEEMQNEEKKSKSEDA